MIDRSRIGGVVVPMMTPLQADGVTVHETGVHQLVERLVSQGVHGLFVGGTTGEVWALDDEQWACLVRFAKEALRGRLPLYVGVSHEATAGAVARARLAEQLGADILVSLAPYYIAPGQADIVRHFQALAGAATLPIIVYQYPGIVKTSISLATYSELAKIPGIVGVKDSMADVTEFYQMALALRAGGQDFRLLLGTDILGHVAVMLGGQGLVPGLGNIAAPSIVAGYDAALAGDWQRSGELQAQAAAIRAVYRVATGDGPFDGSLPGMKAALNLLGVEAGPPAAPLRSCTPAEMDTIADILRRGGLLA
ncbi:MAG: dihydrodipicolinate synthase family protein [Caldilineaceae bacterium]|nr:dihydrodipicolinate synthase family protein [Caldilineaceae bacterium]